MAKIKVDELQNVVNFNHLFLSLHINNQFVVNCAVIVTRVTSILDLKTKKNEIIFIKFEKLKFQTNKSHSHLILDALRNEHTCKFSHWNIQPTIAP